MYSFVSSITIITHVSSFPHGQLFPFLIFRSRKSRPVNKSSDRLQDTQADELAVELYI